jgi:hypothetical protein
MIKLNIKKLQINIMYFQIEYLKKYDSVVSKY